MENENTVRQALEELEELEDNVNEYGWIITDEDNCLDPWFGEDKEDDQALNESIGILSPCDIVFCSSEVQHVGEKPKRRPVVVVCQTGASSSTLFYGMQITSTPPGNSFRNKFKSEIKDWKLVGLKNQSYVNYDHFVRNLDDDIRTNGRAWLTKRDSKELLKNIEKDYDDLIRLGYSMQQDRNLLDRFIEYLRKI